MMTGGAGCQDGVWCLLSGAAAIVIFAWVGIVAASPYVRLYTLGIFPQLVASAVTNLPPPFRRRSALELTGHRRR